MIAAGTEIELAHGMVRSLGAVPFRSRAIVGLGSVNHVIVIATSRGKWVVRFSKDSLDTDQFDKEEFLLNQCARNDIPTPQFVGRGTLDSVPFLVQEFAEGIHGEKRRTLELWRTLGAYAAQINCFELEGAPQTLLSRFGSDLAQNWRCHLDYNLGQLSMEDPLLALGVYVLVDQPKLKLIFERLFEVTKRFGVCHGDLVPRNVLLTAEPPGLVVLDWGSASTGPQPYSDLLGLMASQESMGEPNDYEIRAYAEGMGEDIDTLMPALLDMQLLNRIDLVRWAIDQRPDRLAEIVQRSRNATRRLLAKA